MPKNRSDDATGLAFDRRGDKLCLNDASCLYASAAQVKVVTVTENFGVAVATKRKKLDSVLRKLPPGIRSVKESIPSSFRYHASLRRDMVLSQSQH